MSNQTPSKGRVVLYTLSDKHADNPGAQRPGIITEAHENGDCALIVFTDAAQDGAAPVVYVKGAREAAGTLNEDGVLRFKPGTWQWPPYVAPKASPLEEKHHKKAHKAEEPPFSFSVDKAAK